MDPRRRLAHVYLVALLLGISVLPASPAAATEHPCHAQDVTIRGDAGDDTLPGTEGDDVIDGGPGNDTINGLGGVDVICGGDGDDTVDGGNGDDTIDGQAGDDLIFGGLGDDPIGGGDGDDAIEGGGGSDPIDGGPNSDSSGDWIYFSDAVTVDLARGTSQGEADGTDQLSNIENVYGSPGQDTIFGDDGPNYLLGWDGNDFIGARNGEDVVNGMGGNDAMFGGGGVNDWLVYFDASAPVAVDLQTEEARVGFTEVEQQDGLTGFESLSGSPHDDFLYGDAGTNYLAGGDGTDTLSGRGGFDIATFYRAVVANLGTGRATSTRQAPMPDGTGDPVNVTDRDALVGLEGLWGSPDWDTLIGNRANNLLRGDGGVDKMRGLGGQDYLLHEENDPEEAEGVISGGDGSYDLVDYSLSPAGMAVDITSGLNGVGGQLVGVEGLLGSVYADTFTGDDRANYMFGAAGNDALRGKRGKDGLAGGGGDDELAGGPAWDRCVQGEEKTGCEEAALPPPHPLVSVAGKMFRPEALQPGAGGPEDPRRYK